VSHSDLSETFPTVKVARSRREKNDLKTGGEKFDSSGLVLKRLFLLTDKIKKWGLEHSERTLRLSYLR